LGQLLPFRAVFLRLHLREFLCNAARPYQHVHASS
jgi:hypothetical protein